MRIDLVTLFPEMFSAVRDLGVTGRAHLNALWALKTWNPRVYTARLTIARMAAGREW